MIAMFNASRNGPALNSECAVTNKSCVWTVSSVKYRADMSAIPTEAPTSLVNVVFDGAEFASQLTAPDLPAGYWDVTVNASASWTIEKSAGCGDCDCGGCANAAGSVTIAFAVVAVDRIIVKDSDPEVVGSAQIWVDDSVTLEAKPKPADATFPNGTPKWSLEKKPTGSSATAPTDPSKTMTIKPDKSGDYEIKTTCGTSSAFFTITAYKLTIEKGGIDITDTTTTTVVGMKISLTARIDPAPPGNVMYKWTIPGTNVKSYSMAIDKAKKPI